MCLEEGIESGSDGIERNRNKRTHDSVHQNTTAGTFFILSCKITLYDCLIRSIRNQIVGQTAKNNNPEGRFGIVEKAELIILQGYVEKSVHSAFRVKYQIAGCQQCAANQDDSLYNIAPYHCLYTTHRTVNNGNNSHQHYTSVDIDTCNGSQRQGRKIKHQCHSRHHKDNEEQTGHQTRGIVKPPLQIFVSTCHIKPSEERQVVLDDREGNNQYGDEHGIICPVGGVCLCRNSHVSDGAQHCGINTDACRPPRDTSTAFEEILRTVLAAHKIIPQKKHA